MFFVTWILWERNHNVLSSIDHFTGNVELIDDKSYTLPFEDLYERRYRHISLKTENLGNIEAFISAPKTIPKGGLPVVMIMGGLEVNGETFKLIHEPGENIYVIYKYPYAPEYWKEGSPMIEIPVIRKLILNVPSQVLALHQWVSKQNWSPKARITFTGFSLGGGMATVLSYIANLPNTYTIVFGSPRVGNRAFVTDFQTRTNIRMYQRWVFNNDPIPNLPPGIVYKHIPGIKHIKADSDIIHEVETCSLCELLHNDRKDHDLMKYYDKIDTTPIV